MRKIGILFILIYFLIIIFVLEIAVALFVLSGLEGPIARFQVISMLTGTGFTTKESELILRHPVRRKIGIFLILFGVFSLAVIISVLSTFLKESFRIVQLTGVVIVLGAVLVIVKNKRFHRRFEKHFHEHLKRDFELHELPIQEVLYLADNDLFTRVGIYLESDFVDKQVAEVFPRDEDIHLLFIQRGMEKLRADLFKEKLNVGDLLFLYGNKALIEGKFKMELEKANEQILDEKTIAAIE